MVLGALHGATWEEFRAQVLVIVLVAQAQLGGLVLVTRDPDTARCDVPVVTA